MAGKGKENEFYSNLESIISLSDNDIVKLINSEYIKLNQQTIKKDQLLGFLQDISKTYDSQQNSLAFKHIGVNWDRTHLIFCPPPLPQLAKELKNGRIKDGELIYVSLGTHAFGISKVANGFYVFEPEYIRRTLLKTEEEVARFIGITAELSESQVHGMDLCFLSYGNINQEIDKFITQFEKIIENEKKDDYSFLEEKNLIDDYNNRKISQIDFGRMFSIYLEKYTNLNISQELKDFASQFKLYMAQQSIIKDFEAMANQFKNSSMLNRMNYQGVTSLYLAVFNNQPSLVDYLLEQGINPNLKNKNGNTALQLAADKGNVECLKYLLNKGANPNEIDKDGNTALYLAAQKGRIECLEYLLKNGANPNQANKDGWTPLHNAAKKGKVEGLIHLLSNGANPNQANNYGNPPLFTAISAGKIDCLKCLLDYGADPNQINKSGWTPLYVAAQAGNIDCLKMLSQVCAPNLLNQATAEGITPLYIAIKKGHYDCVKNLLESGAKCTMPNKISTKDLLEKAEQNGQRLAMKKLLEGAQLSQGNLFFQTSLPDKLDGFNALHAAVVFGHKEMVKELLSNHADINSCTQNGLSALDLAVAMNHQDIIEVLKTQGPLKFS